MIRANLLPRRRETLSFFSFELEYGLIRESALAIAIVALVALIGLAVERYRIDQLTSAATVLETRVAADSAQREVSHRLMLQVARYQQFDRAEQHYRRSGALAALAVARIGNSLPASVWVDNITHVDSGYTLDGGARSLDSIASAVASLSHDDPASAASLTSIQNGAERGKPVRFSARIKTRQRAASAR